MSPGSRARSGNFSPGGGSTRNSSRISAGACGESCSSIDTDRSPFHESLAGKYAAGIPALAEEVNRMVPPLTQRPTIMDRDGALTPLSGHFFHHPRLVGSDAAHDAVALGSNGAPAPVGPSHGRETTRCA